MFVLRSSIKARTRSGLIRSGGEMERSSGYFVFKKPSQRRYVHLIILRALLHDGFAYAQTAAALGAMTSNYLINNAVTYRDRRKRGLALLVGYGKFVLLCSVPLAANVAVATMVYERGPAWWVAGIAGAVVAAVWNYVTTARAVW